jgi:hypothetical protein
MSDQVARTLEIAVRPRARHCRCSASLRRSGRRGAPCGAVGRVSGRFLGRKVNACHATRIAVTRLNHFNPTGTWATCSGLRPRHGPSTSARGAPSPDVTGEVQRGIHSLPVSVESPSRRSSDVDDTPAGRSGTSADITRQTQESGRVPSAGNVSGCRWGEPAHRCSPLACD